MTGSPTLDVRVAQPADEADLLQLFRATFGHDRTRQRWSWQYHRTPMGPGLAAIGCQGGATVACRALMRQDLNFHGARVPAAQAADTMVLASCRGGGVYQRLVAVGHQEALSQGISVVHGYPNPQALPLAARLGRTRVLVLRRYYRRIGTERLGRGLNRFVLRPAFAIAGRSALLAATLRGDRALTVSTTPSIPDDLETLLSQWRRQQLISVWKDTAYLRWRYDDHPELHYDIHVLRAGTTPVALAVIRSGPPCITICEFLHGAYDVREAAFLLRHAAAYYSRFRRHDLIEFYGYDMSFFDDVFREAGFQRRTHSPFALAAAELAETPLTPVLRIPTSWTIVGGDTDVL